MKKLVCILSLGFISLQGFSQMEIPKTEDAEAIKRLPLLVELETRDEKFIAKLPKKDKNENIQLYLSELEAYNSDIKKAFEKNWTFSNEVKFVTDTELEVLLDDKTNKGKYAYFKKDAKVGNARSMMSITSLIDKTYFTIHLFGEGEVNSMMYSDEVQNQADLKFIIQQFQNSLNLALSMKDGKKTKKQIKEEFNAQTLKIKDKVLWISNENLRDAVIRDMDELYKHKYKIVTKEEIDNAILNNDPNVVYLKMVPFKHMNKVKSSNPGGNQSPHKTSSVNVGKTLAYGNTSFNDSKSTTVLFAQYIADAEDGELLYSDEPRAFTTMSMGDSETLGKFDIKNIVKAIEGK